MKYKVGDKVRVYDIDRGTSHTTHDFGIIESIEGRALFVRMRFWGTPDNNVFWFHEKQCRKLVKKKKEVNINDPAKSLACSKIIQKFNDAANIQWENICSNSPVLKNSQVPEDIKSYEQTHTDLVMDRINWLLGQFRK